MIKLYISALAIALVAGTVKAQQHHAVLKTPKQRDGSMPSMHPLPPPAGLDGATERVAFYSEDFSDGALPTGWTTVDDMTPGGQTPVNFEWSNDPGDVTVASLNWEQILTFLAPGANNGYLWANSDRGLTSAPTTNHLTRLTTGAIDCSGQPSVLLTMKSTIGVYDNDADTAVKVRVSTDGVNWTNFAPFPCLKTGNPTPPCERFSYNPQSVAVNISSVAANQSTVYLQFQWRGGWEYYWAIDDVELSPIPENELVMDYGYTSQFGGGYEFGRVPQSQMLSTINVGASISNFGLNTQENITVNISLKNSSGTEVASTSINLPDILNADTAVADANLTIPSPLPLGLYTAHFTVTSDAIGQDDDPTNNEQYRYFEVTEDVYGLDGVGVYPDSIQSHSQAGTASFVDNTQDVRFLNYVEVHEDMTVTGVTMLLGSSTEVGSFFIATVADTAAYTLSPATPGSPLVESDIRVITEDDIAAGEASVAFFDPYTLSPGGYFVGVKLYQEGESDVYILDDNTVPQPGMASVLWTPVDPDNNYLYGGNGTAWGVRLSSNTSIGVQELPALQGVTLYPSPTNGPVEIRLDAPGKMNVEVFNALGKLVKTASFNGNRTTLDLSGNAAGIYTVRVSDGARANVQRITLK